MTTPKPTTPLSKVLEEIQAIRNVAGDIGIGYFQNAEGVVKKRGNVGGVVSRACDRLQAAWSAAKAHPSAQGGQNVGGLLVNSLAEELYRQHEGSVNLANDTEIMRVRYRQLAQTAISFLSRSANGEVVETTAQPASTMGEREAFDSWRNRVCSDADYAEDFCGHSAWEGWQARAAQANAVVDEEEIQAVILRAVEAGNDEYWRPSNEHNDALRKWKLGGFKGEKPEAVRLHDKSIIECISDSVKHRLMPYVRPATPDRALERVRDALEPSGSPSGPDFLGWMADRLVNVYGESENVDFVLALRRKAAKARTALATLNDMLKDKAHD